MGNETGEFLKILEDVLKGYGFSPIVTWAIRFFLRNPYEGLIVVNENGEIEFMDKGSEKSLNLPLGGAKGTKVADLYQKQICQGFWKLALLL